MSTAPFVRGRLDTEQIVTAAIALADADGLEAASMRRVADALRVTPMALYKHVRDRERLIDAMVDRVVAEIDDEPAPGFPASAWRARLRERILRSRTVISRHPWARAAIETRQHASPIVLRHMDILIGMLRDGGFSLTLVHDVMHALSTRMWGFTRDVFPTPTLPADPADRTVMLEQFSVEYPNIVAMAGTIEHTGGCDEQAEFEFALDLMLEGFERAAAA